MPVPLPLWVERKLDSLVDEYSDRDLNKRKLDQLRADMQEIGLGQYFPETVNQITRTKKHDRSD